MKKVVGMLMTAALVVTSLATVPMKSQAAEEENTYGLSNPKVAYNTREYLYFGHYLQNDTNGDGVIDDNDEKEPIKWQVLSRDGDDVFLLADQILDAKPYYSGKTVTKEDGTEKTDYSCTWETSDIRSWLNNDFINTAFTESEQTSIIESDVVNYFNNAFSNTDAGNDTQDKIFLLSYYETRDIEYEFCNWMNEAQARHGKITDYASQRGLSKSADGCGLWWTRTPGRYNTYCGSVTSAGYDNYDCKVYEAKGVRPALHINLSSAGIEIEGAVNVSQKKVVYDTVKFGQYLGKDIIWRVLNVDGDDAYLLAEKCVTESWQNGSLPGGSYQNGKTWEDSLVRQWLNEEFYNEAFTDEERAAIKLTMVVNDDNSYYGTDGGNDTEDYIYLLSLSEIINPEYGFSDALRCDCKSRYADGNLYREDEDYDLSEWWLRSPGRYGGSYFAAVNNSGYVMCNGMSKQSNNGVRPVLHIDLSSSAWTKGDDIEISSEYDHSVHNEKIIPAVAATCTDTGLTAGIKCSVCGKKILGCDEIDALGHDYEDIENTAITASCTELGKRADKKCSVCGEFEEGTVIPALGHTWDDGVVTKEATATETGIRTYTCSVCGETRTVEIPATGEKSSEKPTETPTEQPTTEQPNTEQPKTEQPSTQQPTTQKTSEQPTTAQPTTEAKTTEDGVGTISADGKTLTDEDGDEYLIADTLSNSELKKNLSVADKSSVGKYKITKITKKSGKVTGGTVTYVKPYNKNSKSATIKASIKIAGATFKVTAVNKNAFKSNKKLTKVTIGSNVTKIGTNAFNGCSKLKTVTIKSAKLSSIGSKAFKGIYKTAKFKVPKKKLSKYKKMIKKAKAPAKAKITK